MSGAPTPSHAPSGCPTSSLPAPSPSVVLAPPLIVNCPWFAPSPYQRWRREIQLRTAGYPQAAVSKFLSKITDALPPAAKITGMSYMASNDSGHKLRTADAMMLMLDERYAEAGTEREWARMGEFTAFARKTKGDMGDFWARMLRVTARQEELPMKMNDGRFPQWQYMRFHCRAGNFLRRCRRSKPNPTDTASTA